MRNKIENIFENHWKYYKKQSVETIKQQSGQIEQVTSDYEGRVLYELLQNAFDKAKEKILIKVDEEYVYIANDGERFSFKNDFDYEGKTEGKIKRGDFQSLCSISTSSKDASKSIGNKGVGFKSVYSLNKYADVFVKPKIIDFNKEEIIDKWIGFRIYGEIKKEDIKDFRNQNFKYCSKLEEQLEALTNEFPNRGIPGFYYPILLDETLKDFDEYVTVIRIKHNNKIKELIEELNKVHFYFVSLKYNKNIKIVINEFDKSIKEKFIQPDTNEVNLIYSNLIKDKINPLKKNISLSIDNPQVAICYNYNKYDKLIYDDLIYNYLPTKVQSPFKNVDFHADFLTSVDRKSIELDKGNVAEYNKALFRACIELHFYNLAKIFGYETNNFNLEYIDINSIENNAFRIDEFKWEFLQLNPNLKNKTIEIIEKIFKKDNKEIWPNFANFIITIAKEYFNTQKKLKDYDNFWQVIFEYFDFLYRKNRGYDLFSIMGIRKNFGETILQSLKENDIKCVPITKKENNNEKLITVKTFNDPVFYKNKDNKIDIPKEIIDNLKIYITVYNFKNRINNLIEINSEIPEKERKINLKEFSNYDELLKYFRQISSKGEISDKKIEENKYKRILKAVYSIFKAKNETDYLTTHRYEELLSSKANKNYLSIAANFAISTLFLKIKTGKYKPAQFCWVNEIDENFLKNIIENEDKDNFLKFLGVSFDENIRYVDFEEEFELDYIPALINPNEEQKYDIKKMRLIYQNKYNKYKKHPALYYKSDIYEPFLTYIKSKNKEDSLSKVVKNLEEYPKKYVEILIEYLENKTEELNRNKNIVFKLYKEIFKKYKKNKFLVFTKEGKFEWYKLEDKDFFIATTKKDFELLKEKVNILATFANISNDDKLDPYKAELEFNVYEEGKTTDEKKAEIEKFIPYILLAITNTEDRESRKNFLENEETLNSYFEKWQELQFIEFKEKIPVNIKIKNYDETFTEKYDKPIIIDKKIYFISKNRLYEFADVLSEFFGVKKLKTVIENILLKKEEYKKEIERDENLKEDFKKILEKWIKIDEKTKNLILNELKEIGFRNDITFKLNYTKKDFDCKKNKDITQEEIQKSLKEIKEKFNLKFNLDFNCIDENEGIINKFSSKYLDCLKDYFKKEKEKLGFLEELFEECKNTICLTENKLKEVIQKKLELDKDLDSIYEEYKSSELPELETFVPTKIKPKVICEKNIGYKEISEEERQKKQKAIEKAKTQRGSRAEKIFAKHIYEKICKNNLELIKKNIDKFIPKNWEKTREKLKKINKANDLIISNINTTAGYDVIGCEVNKIILCEVKAIDFDNPYLYLTSNEIRNLKYYKNLKEKEDNSKLTYENCEWRLIGVDENKAKHIDLTEEVFNLLFEKKEDGEIEEKDYLQKLRENGINYDSLIIEFEKFE